MTIPLAWRFIVGNMPHGGWEWLVLMLASAAGCAALVVWNERARS